MEKLSTAVEAGYFEAEFNNGVVLVTFPCFIDAITEMDIRMNDNEV